jgi:hypothetical protein
MNDADPSPRPRCEQKDADPAVAAILASSMAAIVAVGLLCGLLIMRAHSGATMPESQPGDDVFQHGPEARTDMEHAWESLDHDPTAVANTYAWVDRGAGVVQVPIGRAIDLVCEDQARAPSAPKDIR